MGTIEQALFRCEARAFLADQPIPELQLFDLAGCAAEVTLLEEHDADALPQEEEAQPTGIVDWRRTRKDPFAGQWKQILAWGKPTRRRVVATSFENSSRCFLADMRTRICVRFSEGCARCGHRCSPSQESKAPQKNAKNTRILLSIWSQPGQRASLETPSFAVDEKRPLPDSSDQHPAGEDRSSRVERTQKHPFPFSKPVSDQVARRAHTASSRLVHRPSSRKKSQRLTLEGAIQQYLQAHRPKTLEWHQMVLAPVHQYLQTDGHLVLVHQLTETALRNWLEWLSQTPTLKGAPRSASTIEAYARSTRAFCGWLVEQGVLSCPPLGERLFPRTEVPLPQGVSPALFEQLMRAGFPPPAPTRGARRLLARDRALLWVLFDTGITVTERCALRVADLDQQTGVLRVRGKGGKERHMPLGTPCLSHLRSYLRQMNPAIRSGLERRQVGGDPLFGSQGKEPLTKNGVTMVFARFRKRAAISEAPMTPQILRHSFALRYLQTGGKPRGLQELLGYEGMAPVRQYLCWHEQMLQEQRPQEEEKDENREGDDLSIELQGTKQGL